MQKMLKQNCLQFLFAVKATAIKQQTSQFCLQILSTEPSFYIYGWSLTGINVMAVLNKKILQILLGYCYRINHLQLSESTDNGLTDAYSVVQ